MKLNPNIWPGGFLPQGMIDWKFSDGGRKESGRKNRSQMDCGVRAIALADRKPGESQGEAYNRVFAAISKRKQKHHREDPASRQRAKKFTGYSNGVLRLLTNKSVLQQYLLDLNFTLFQLSKSVTWSHIGQTSWIRHCIVTNWNDDHLVYIHGNTVYTTQDARKYHDSNRQTLAEALAEGPQCFHENTTSEIYRPPGNPPKMPQ